VLTKASMGNMLTQSLMGGNKQEFGSVENKEIKYEQWRAKKRLMVGELTNWQEKGKGFLDGGEGKQSHIVVGDDDREHGHRREGQKSVRSKQCRWHR